VTQIDTGGSTPAAESDRRTGLTVVGEEGGTVDAARDGERVRDDARGEPERKKGWGLFRKGDRGGDR
jgi:hypothetical protein